MKRFLLFTSAIALCMVAGVASAAITGSGHDFSGELWSGGEICVVCHAPHNNQNTGGTLLWNHESSGATYTPYNSPTFEEGPATVSGSSLVCLSCHDGTVAVDNFGGTTGGSVYVATENNVGNDLTDDHPVSFTYDITDEELAATTTPVIFANGSGDIADMLEGGTEVQCSSCHDVHNTLSAGAPDLLLIDNTGSALCLTCHTK